MHMMRFYISYISILCSIIQSGKSEGYMECESCYIHPDSINGDLVKCDDVTDLCPSVEGCWELKKRTYTLKGCFANVITSDLNIDVSFDENEETYCSKFWKDGVCVKKMCISCSDGTQLHTDSFTLYIAMAVYMLGTVTF